MYQLPTTEPVTRPSAAENGYAADRSGRPLTADDRQPEPEDSIADPNVTALLAHIRVTSAGRFKFKDFECPVRPIVANLLKLLAAGDGRPVPLEKVCQHLWRRPTAPSYSTFHVTIYKANRALRIAHCPIRLKSRLNHLLLISE
jgi:DNA-binding response OmpR family regulator